MVSWFRQNNPTQRKQWHAGSGRDRGGSHGLEGQAAGRDSAGQGDGIHQPHRGDGGRSGAGVAGQDRRKRGECYLLLCNSSAAGVAVAVTRSGVSVCVCCRRSVGFCFSSLSFSGGMNSSGVDSFFNSLQTSLSLTSVGGAVCMRPCLVLL